MKFYLPKMTILAASMALVLTGCGGEEGDDGAVGTAGAAGATGATGAAGKDASMAPEVYAGFPVNLDVTTDKTTSVSYAGQMARHVLREQLKKALASSPTATTKDDIVTEVERYLKNPDGVADELTLIAPTDKNGFDILETKSGDLSSKKLYDDVFRPDSKDYADTISGVSDTNKNVTMGVPGSKSAQEVTDLWVANFASNWVAIKDSTLASKYAYIDMSNGLEYDQLMAKFLMGALFYNQAVDKYLDDYLDSKTNSAPYKDGAIYSGIEHSWDEAFGYFGAAANYGVLPADINYSIKKQYEGYADYADWNGDGQVSLYTEYTSGPAYYAADSDKVNKSSYGKDIMGAFLKGRHLIANAVDSDGHARDLTTIEKATLKGYAKTIQRNWEMVFAEAVYKYAGASYDYIDEYQTSQDDSDLRKYYHLWSEGKGMMLALQYGGAGSKMTATKFAEIDNLLGFGPVTAAGDQVTGVDGSDNFTRTVVNADANTALDAYQLKLKEVQEKLDDLYSLKAKKNTIE